MMTDRIKYLIEKSLAEKASGAELEELAYLCQLPEYSEVSRTLLKEALEAPKKVVDLEEPIAERIRLSILEEEPVDTSRPVAFFSLKRLAAACVVILFATGVVYFLHNRNSGQLVVKEENSAASPVIMPGSNRAMLTLDDGTSFALDSLANGQIRMNGPLKVIKGDGLLSYEAEGKTPTGKPGYSTVTTPRGGQYMVELPDGTKVWLNAASSIRFPNSFAGNDERRVDITGEVYFEVAITPVPGGNRLPFIVNSNGMEVKVLGTHFNVMAYAEEKDIQTTLLKGSVVVSGAEQPVWLKPAEQLRLMASGAYTVRKLENPEQAIAWKNGRFELNGSIEGIMRQIARWYDVEVKYEGDLSGRKFGGAISRSESLEAVLKMLELTENISFRTEGRTVIVSS